MHFKQSLGWAPFTDEGMLVTDHQLCQECPPNDLLTGKYAFNNIHKYLSPAES